MSTFTALAAMAVIAQDPSFDYPSAKHVGYDSTPSDPADVVAPLQAGQAETVSQSQKVSVSFKNAPISDVLDWLKDHGVDFVVGDDQVDKGRTISLNLTNRSIEDVMGSLGPALGGHWERKSDVWIFHKGAMWFGEGEALIPPSVRVTQSKPLEVQGLATPQGESKVKLFQSQGNRTLAIPAPMTGEQRKALEKALADSQNPKAWEEFQKSMEKWSKDFEKSMKEQNFQFHFDQAKVEELAKRSAVLAKGAESYRIQLKPGETKGFTWNGKELKGIDEKDVQKMHQHAQELAKAMQEREWVNQKDQKAFVLQMQKHAADAAKSARTVTVTPNGAYVLTPRAATSNVHNLKQVYDLMTPAQEAKMKRQGYINYSDLNARQRDLLGIINGDSWTITYENGNKKLTIKSDR